MKSYFQYNNISIAYTKMGKGKEILLCFHGFGLSSKSFSYLESSLEQKYTCYAIDFFFHGDTESPSSDFTRSFTSAVLVDIILQFLKEIKVTKFNIIAYSMGARLSMALMDKMSERIEKVVFIAPDGIYDSFWFKFSTKTNLGRLLFKKFTHNPNPFYKLMNIAIYLKLIKTKKKKFAEINTGNEFKRHQVYNTWNLLEKLAYSHEQIGLKIERDKLQFNIIVGKYDSVIVTKKLFSWSWLSRNRECLLFLNTGHAMNEQLLLETISTQEFL